MSSISGLTTLTRVAIAADAVEQMSRNSDQ